MFRFFFQSQKDQIVGMKVWYVVEYSVLYQCLRAKIDSPDPDLSEISRHAREDYINFVYCDSLNHAKFLLRET